MVSSTGPTTSPDMPKTSKPPNTAIVIDTVCWFMREPTKDWKQNIIRAPYHQAAPSGHQQRLGHMLRQS